MRKKCILYAGDSPVGGPANYLLALLNYAGFETLHVDPGVALTESDLDKPIDGIIFSDYSAKQVSRVCQKAIVEKVGHEKVGFLMVGGWGSFSGPFGGWRGSLIDEILPVKCLPQDDRLNFPGGAFIIDEKSPRIFSDLKFTNSPVICGMNQVQLCQHSEIVLSLKAIKNTGGRLSLSKSKHPLLVIHNKPGLRSAALTTDFAPHWCGGFVDWGIKTHRLGVTNKISVQVGNYYMRFAKDLFHWMTQLR